MIDHGWDNNLLVIELLIWFDCLDKWLPQEIAGSKNKKIVSNKQLVSDSFDEEQPGTSKESSPAPLPYPNDLNLVTSKTDADVKKTGQEQINFFSGNPFVEKVQGILHFYKEK